MLPLTLEYALCTTNPPSSSPSVSYTHLDVYKRQCQKTLADLVGEWCQYRVQTVRRRTDFRLNKANERIHILEGRHIAVSYTHLDVYKRQT